MCRWTVTVTGVSIEQGMCQPEITRLDGASASTRSPRLGPTTGIGGQCLRARQVHARRSPLEQAFGRVRVQNLHVPPSRQGMCLAAGPRPTRGTLQLISGLPNAFRHGLTVHALALMTFYPGTPPTVWSDGSVAFDAVREWPALYVGLAILIACALTFGTSSSLASISRERSFFVPYALSVAISEEWLYRVAIPILLTPWLSFWPIAIISNTIFGFVHAVTLRWRVRSCLWVAAGGVLLNLVYEISTDLGALILIHFAFALYGRVLLERWVGPRLAHRFGLVRVAVGGPR